MLNDVKKKTWRTFKIHTLQPLQYTVYKAPGGRYNWHCDTGPHHSGMEQRILSLVVQLFDPNTYEGGEFEIAEHAEYDLSKAMWGQAPNRDTVRSISAPQGSVTVFPSFIQHRVLPVTKGTRKSLVGWCDGKFI
jgi:PKHD-type hydroxylase